MRRRLTDMVVRAFKRNRPRFGGWRGFSLLGLSLMCLSRAAVYLPVGAKRREVPASIQALVQGSPLTVTGWGILWLIAALALVVGAHMPRSTWALGAFLFMCAASAGAYGLSWLTLFPPDNGEWSSALLYGGLAVAAFGLIKVDMRLARHASILRLINEAEQASHTERH